LLVNNSNARPGLKKTNVDWKKLDRRVVVLFEIAAAETETLEGVK